MSADRVLATESLSCAIGGRTVLRDVDLRLGAGEMLAVVGVNGSGKSTLLRTCAGLLPPPAGRVLVGGADVHRMGARHRARGIAFVAQEERPPADMRVGEYVALGRLPYRPPWASGREDREAASRALDHVGLADAVDRSCADLSGGERRRISLARGLAQDCDLLVLDEPTNHLDVRHQVELLDLLRRSGLSVLLAIHDLGLAAAYVDRVAVLDRGGVVADGPPDQALTPTVVREVFGVEARHLRDDARHAHLVVGPGRPELPIRDTPTREDCETR